MGLSFCVSLICCLFSLAPVVESQGFGIPFWERQPTTQPTLPPSSDKEYYEKFEAIPPKSETADKLIEDFFGIHGTTAKRRLYLNDNIAILDSSGSIGDCEYKKGRRALKYLMDIEKRPNYINYWAGVEYSDSATIKFVFLPAARAKSEVDTSFSYESGSTNTADGLAKAKDLFEDPNAGGRPGARQIVFLLTDGQSNRNAANTIPNAKLLKDDGVEIFLVAVGNYITGIEEMVRVASSPPERHIFRVATFNDFLKVVLLALQKVNPDSYEIIGKIPPPC